MNPARTPVQWLRTFETAARHLSLSGAAQELHVTASAVSQQVRLLERRLGVLLFVRHARGLRLTRSGESLLPACRESFYRLESALSELFGATGGSRLAIRVPLGFARDWLLRKIEGFSAQHPDIVLRVLATVWASEPLDDTLDAEIRLASSPPPGRETRQLTHDEVFPVCSPRLLTRKLRLRHPADLKEQLLLSSIGFAEGWPEWFRAAKLGDHRPRPRLEFDSMRLALETAALGRGIALARTSYAEDLLRQGRLRRLFDVSLLARENVYLSVPPNLGANAPAAMLRDWLLDQ